MPELSTTLHLEMLQQFHGEKIPLLAAVARGYASRQALEQAISSGTLPVDVRPNGARMLRLADLRRLFGDNGVKPELYGMRWGDPDEFEPLKFVKDRYLLPLVSRDMTVVEIGPGGGRWTRYLLGVKRLYAVDYHQELLDELARNFVQPYFVIIMNNGDDFPGIEDASVDLVFSFGVFVHLELPTIGRYLTEMRRILKPAGTVFIQYSDKTKIMAAINRGFAENNPEKMRTLLAEHGYRIVQEDTTTLWHSGIVIFQMIT